MVSDLDTSRGLRTRDERRRLIETVRDATGAEFESDWLEWKSTVDLRALPWKAEIARQVLGFANRDPDIAARVVGGCAYLLLGVEPGNLCGLKAVDLAELEAAVSEYVGGPAGPQWDPNYEQVAEKTVLVITIEPPQWGQAGFRLRKEVSFEDPDTGARIHWQSGDTFVRRQGRTQKARAEDHDMLDRRAMQSPKTGPRLDVELKWAGDEMPTIRPIDVSPTSCANWLKREREILLSPLKQLAEAPEARKLDMFADDLRSPDNYRKEVEAYVDAAADALPAKLRIQAVTRLPPLQLELGNRTEDNFDDVRVEVRISEDRIAAAFEPDDLSDLNGPSYPRRPAIWGRPVRPADFRLSPSLLLPSARRRPRGWVDNSGSARIVFPSRDMRPLYAYSLDPVYVAVEDSHAGTDIVATWHASARNVSGMVGGKLIIRVDEQPASPAELMGRG